MSILSQKYKDYQFIQGTSEQGTSDDLISRQAVLDGIEELKGSPWFNDNTNEARIIRREALNIVEDLCIRDLPSVTPSVNPQEPKTGYWEQYGYPWEDKFKCSECGEEQPKILCGERIIGYWSDYCPNCGCRMIEPQESEE